MYIKSKDKLRELEKEQSEIVESLDRLVECNKILDSIQGISKKMVKDTKTHISGMNLQLYTRYGRSAYQAVLIRRSRSKEESPQKDTPKETGRRDVDTKKVRRWE